MTQDANLPPCPHRTPTGANVVCDLLPGLLIGWQVCEGCDGEDPENTLRSDRESRVTVVRGTSTAVGERGAEEARRLNDPCFHRGSIPTNREEVCCGMLYTYDCALGEFGGLVTVSQCAGCEKYA